jgi:hypothetical protein
VRWNPWEIQRDFCVCDRLKGVGDLSLPLLVSLVILRDIFRSCFVILSDFFTVKFGDAGTLIQHSFLLDSLIASSTVLVYKPRNESMGYEFN